MKNCERIKTCKDATIKNVSCKHYNDVDGYPCEHECSYWEEIKDIYGGLDEKHRFPLYKPGDKLYIVDMTFIESFIPLLIMALICNQWCRS